MIGRMGWFLAHFQEGSKHLPARNGTWGREEGNYLWEDILSSEEI